MLRFAVALTLCILIASRAFAMPSTCPFAEDSKEEKLCISFEADQAERTMKVYLQAAKEAVATDASLVQQIINSQAAWLDYRKEQCDNEILWAKLGRKPLSFRSGMECQLDLTHNRTRDIWAVYLSRADPGPTLPEPQLSRK